MKNDPFQTAKQRFYSLLDNTLLKVVCPRPRLRSFEWAKGDEKRAKESKFEGVISLWLSRQKKNDEKLATATRALSMCSSGFWLFRNERRRSGSIEPIHPRRPRECSSNRLSTTLESGNLIIHTGRTNEENKDAKVLRERTILISMGSVFFFDGVRFSK